jgi:hypothetical protein
MGLTPVLNIVQENETYLISLNLVQEETKTTIKPEYHRLSKKIKTTLDKIVKDTKALPEKEVYEKYIASIRTQDDPKWTLWGSPISFKGMEITPAYFEPDYFVEIKVYIPHKWKRVNKQMIESYIHYCPRCSGEEEIDDLLYKNLKMMWGYSKEEMSFSFSGHLLFKENMAEVIKEFKNNLPKALDIFIERFYIDDKPKVEKLLRKEVGKIIESS